MRIWITHVLFQFRECAGSKAQFLTAVQSTKLFRQTQVFRMDGLPDLQFGRCVLETLCSKPANGDLERHQREESHVFSSAC